MQRSPRTATRERILDAALEVFARKGYHRAIVDDIVRTSGTSKGAVYHHFPNKEALFLALVDDFAARLARSAAAAIAEQHGALAKVECALTAALAIFAANERLARLILLEAVSLGPTYQAKRAEVADRFAALIQGYLDEAVGDGSVAPLGTRVAPLARLRALHQVGAPWGPARGAARRSQQRANRAVLHHFRRLVARSGGRRRLVVARLDDRLIRHSGGRGGRRDGPRALDTRALGRSGLHGDRLVLRFRAARHHDTCRERRRGDEPHADGGQLPRITSRRRYALGHTALLCP